MVKIMKKIKRIAAWIGIIVLAVLYLITFLVGIFGLGSTRGLLMACVACTVIIPVLMYAFLLLARLLESRHQPDAVPAESAEKAAAAESAKKTAAAKSAEKAAAAGSDALKTKTARDAQAPQAEDQSSAE